MTKPLINKTALITGASRGIGQRLAETLADAGATVILGSRDVSTLESTEEAIRQRGGIAFGLPLDVSKREHCEEFVAKARELAGMPDILINNAGMGVFRPIDLFQADEFEEQFRVNVFGAFYMMHFCVPLMKQNGGGHIINISSLASKNSAPMGSGYYATKWALQGMSKCVFDEVRQFDIRVTTLCPGSVDTRFHYDSHPNSHEKDQSWMVSPEDIAATALHVLTMPGNCLISDVEIRPAKKPQA